MGKDTNTGKDNTGENNSGNDKQEQFTGAMCGGVVNQTLFESDPMAYMMAYILPDDKFSAYVLAKNTGDDKQAKKIFDEHAWSAI